MLADATYLGTHTFKYVLPMNPSTLADESWLGDFLSSQVYTAQGGEAPCFGSHSLEGTDVSA